MYNRNRFQKINDKKVLHKVRKHWMVVSLALLATVGGGALVDQAAAHADVAPANPQMTSGASQSTAMRSTGLRINHQVQTSNQIASNSDITKQADLLHSQIVRNNVSQNLKNQTIQSAQKHQAKASLIQKRQPNLKASNQQLAPQTFKYVNQNGKKLASQVIRSKGRKSISLSDVTKDFPLPEGYELATKNNTGGLISDDSEYDFSNQQTDRILHVVGKQITNTIEVKVTTRDANRQSTTKDYPITLTGRVGDTQKIDPTGYVMDQNGNRLSKSNWYDTSKYFIDPQDEAQIVSFNPNGTITSQDPEGVRFVYDINGISGPQTPLSHIYIHYLDYAHQDHEIPGSEIPDQWYAGEPFTISAYIQNPPKGYHYVRTINSTGKFTNATQDLHIEVAPNYAPDNDNGNSDVPSGSVPAWTPNQNGNYSYNLISSDNIPSGYVPGEIPDNAGHYVPGYVPKDSSHWPSGTNGDQPIPKYVPGWVPSGNPQWGQFDNNHKFHPGAIKGLVPAPNKDQSANIFITFKDPSDPNDNLNGFFNNMIPFSRAKTGENLRNDSHVMNMLPKGFSIDSVTPSDTAKDKGQYTINLSRDNENLTFNFIDQNGHRVGNSKQVVQKYGTSYQTNNLVAPSGYKIDTSKFSPNQTYVFDFTSPRTVTVPVIAQQNQTAVAKIVYEDADTHQYIGSPVTVNGRIGQAINYSPYEQQSYIRDNISLDYVYSGQLGQHVDKFQANDTQPNVIYLKHRQSQIDIYYVNGSDLGAVKDHITVTGNTNSQFNLVNYLDNLPATLKVQGYSNPRLLTSWINKFTDNPQQLFIGLSQSPKPNNPNKPSNPNKPNKPGNNPLNPSNPNKPNNNSGNNPTNPNKPNNPGNNPSNPSNPSNPNKPGNNPSNPNSPGNKPSNSNNPNNSGSNPSNPGNSNKPGSNPSNPGNPSNSGSTPSNPNNPGSNSSNPGKSGSKALSANHSNNSNANSASRSNQQGSLPKTSQASNEVKIAALMMSVGFGIYTLDDALRRRHII